MVNTDYICHFRQLKKLKSCVSAFNLRKGTGIARSTSYQMLSKWYRSLNVILLCLFSLPRDTHSHSHSHSLTPDRLGKWEDGYSAGWQPYHWVFSCWVSGPQCQELPPSFSSSFSYDSISKERIGERWEGLILLLWVKFITGLELWAIVFFYP